MSTIKFDAQRFLSNVQEPFEVLAEQLTPALGNNLIKFMRSDQEVERYAGIGNPGPLTRDGASSALRTSPAEYDHTISNDLFSTAYQVKKIKTLTAPGIRLLQQEVPQKLAIRAANHTTTLFISLINRGELVPSFTTEPLFSENHDICGNIQSNIHTGTGFLDAQISQDFEDATTRLNSFVDEHGAPLFQSVPAGTAYTIVHDISKTWKFRRIFGTELLDNSDNIFRGVANLQPLNMVAYGGSADDWYIVMNTGMNQPVVIQTLADVSLTTYEDNDNKQIVFYADWFGGVGAGDPFGIIKVKNS